MPVEWLDAQWGEEAVDAVISRHTGAAENPRPAREQVERALDVLDGLDNGTSWLSVVPLLRYACASKSRVRATLVKIGEELLADFDLLDAATGDARAAAKAAANGHEPKPRRRVDPAKLPAMRANAAKARAAKVAKNGAETAAVAS